jgi:alpha-tubulin suppressor-like RCC1 family protein
VEALRGVDVASVAAGYRHVLALTYTGSVYSWGQHELALGHGTPRWEVTETSQLPRRVEALRGVRVRCIAAGHSLSCAVTDEGHVYTWGEGVTGALGHMEFEGEPLPKRVETLYSNGVFAVGVATGCEHSLVADAHGSVWGFGCLNAIGAWNDPTVKAMRDTADVNTDEHHLFASVLSDDLVQNDCFDFLFPRGISSITKPVRVTGNGQQDFTVLRR